MRKAIAAAVVSIAVMLTACGFPTVEVTEDNPPETSMFVEVEHTNGWKVVYNKYTKVMYAVSGGLYNGGTFTVMVNADGSPMLWEE